MWRTLLVAVAAIAALMVVAISTATEPPVVQPIAYNHNLHVEQEGLVCTDCHVQVETHAAASIPDLTVCIDCHDGEPLTESPEEEKLIGHIEEGTEVPWARVYEVPDHVYFSHRRHVVLGELECAVCHGSVAEFQAPVTRMQQVLSMDWCTDCHRASGVTSDCLACHR